MVANAAVLTLLTAVCSIPLVTIGAALSASYEAAWAAKEGRGYLLRTYFSAFKRNFPKAKTVILDYEWGEKLLLSRNPKEFLLKMV